VSTTVPTSAPVPPLQPIAQLFERNLSIQHVYGEPVRQGEVTVIPVAKVAFGFGAGMGRRPRRPPGQGATESEQGDMAAGSGGRTEPEGAGGGGGARMTPVGALEISPRGTRFIHYGQVQQLVGAMAIGLGVGLLLARRRQ